jgi:hypothetical protein
MDHRFEALGYRVQLTEDEGVWVATARRLDTGDMFGPPMPADRAEEAADQLAHWLQWQQAHTKALQALQAAESAYHRLSADRFAVAGDADRAALRAALADVDTRRRQLDDVRAGRPWPH